MAKKCFVICPIGSKDSEIREKSDKVLKYIIKHGLADLDYDIERADSEVHSGSISYKIINELINADLVIADLSTNNPNVLYELAVRHASKKPYIQIAEEGTKVPFDISDINTIFYDITDVESVSNTKELLKSLSKNVLDGKDIKCNNPITNAIKIDLAEKSGGEQETILVNIVQSISNFDKKISYFIDNFEKRIDSLEKEKITRRKIPLKYVTKYNGDNYIEFNKYLDNPEYELDRIEDEILFLKNRKEEAMSNSELNEDEKQIMAKVIDIYDKRIENLHETRNKIIHNI